MSSLKNAISVRQSAPIVHLMSTHRFFRHFTLCGPTAILILEYLGFILLLIELIVELYRVVARWFDYKLLRYSCSSLMLINFHVVHSVGYCN